MCRKQICCAYNDSGAAAFNFIQPLLRRGVDIIHLVHFVQASKDVPFGQKLLESFLPDDIFLDVKREVVVRISQEGGVVGMKSDIEEHARRINATLIVLGTNALGSVNPKTGSLTYNFMSRGLACSTLFINEEHGLEEDDEIRVSTAVTYTSTAMMDFVCQLFRPSRDTVTVIRCSKEGGSSDDSVMLGRYQEMGINKGMRCTGRLIFGKPSIALPEFVTQMKSEILVVPAPAGTGMSPGMKRIFMNNKCPLLMFKDECKKKVEDEDSS
ncbi:hypothetical protein CYMTET_25203 [Cymbomonas tetramitiformis]|uniref:Universal stress protein n=1 Tax=Cymbomonas tetramitiformis TaxID=36881 RepID=A0AAE0FV02_9CHLO|nr:hypothetical protein CYMTET_25203 [Cymbomonas tetramitiformis]